MAGHSAWGDASREDDQHLSPIVPVSPIDTQDVFSDDYAESFNESYAPSVAAASSRHSRSASPSPDCSSSRRDPSHTYNSDCTSPFADPPPQARGSTRKSGSDGGRSTGSDSRRPAGPAFVSGFNGSAGSGSTTLAHRSVSSASSFANSQSPQSTGGDGPSHPYAMYPQGLAMSRTASVASTTRPLSHTNSVRGPTHPYALYTQNVNDDLPSGNQQSSIPVGFLGTGHQFHRRVGPDGEEQDIVGPDGHAEQLPPYSRYPEDEKTAATAAVLPSIGEQRAEETSPILARPQAAHHSAPPVQSPDVAGEPEVSGRHLNEKHWNNKTTKEKWKSKVFGVPLWLFLMVFVLTVVIAVVIGAALGAAISHKKSAQPQTGYGSEPWPESLSTSMAVSPTTTSTALLDVASATSTPVWMHPVPVGNYSINVGEPTVNFSGCLLPQQQSAWSCFLHDETSLLSVTQDGNTTVMSLVDSNPNLQYGSQPPVVTSDEIQLVQDPQTDSQAYAWYFQTTYDKLVILDVNNGLLPLNAHLNSKRDSSKPWYASHKSDYGDPDDMDNVDDNQAWFCYWNETFIEVLIYMANSSNATGVPASAASSAPLSSTLTTSTQTSTSIAATSTVSSTSTVPSSSWPSFYGMGPQQVSSTSSWPAPHRRRGASTPTSASSTTTSTSSSTTSVVPASPIPSKRIKIEERRVPYLNAPPPMCTLMQNGADGNWRPNIQSNGLLTVVALKEEDPVAPAYEQGAKKVKRDQIPADACGCQWLSPEGQRPY